MALDILTFHPPSYPKHVWSPAGGWYTQPSNWKANTFVMGAVIFGLTAMTFNYSAKHEYRTKMPEPDRFYPSRWYVTNNYGISSIADIWKRWSRQIREHEKGVRNES